MKDRLIGFLKTYCLFICIFALQKPFFMLFYRSLYEGVSWMEWLGVMWHGLPLDLSLAGYLTAVPGLLFICSAWTVSNLLRRIWYGYFAFISVLLSVIFTVDLGLYEYWGFRLDATPLFYFFSSPKDAVASVSIWVVIGGIIAMVAYAAALYGIFHGVLLRKRVFERMKIPYRRLRVSGVLLLLTGLLFIPIRGGFTVSTMNTGKVYFSTDQRLNHAAINPAFSLMESLSKQKDFGSQYRFMEADAADRIFSGLADPAVPMRDGLSADSLQQAPDSLHSLFTTKRPDVLFIIMESFSSWLMTTLGGEPGVAVQLDSLAQEGVLFTNFYANSFRTDRGLVAILSGYPAQPTTSIMKYPEKTDGLPSIPRSLKNAGYSLEYYYGGDADFTNMRSYLVSSGIEKIISETDFPLSERQGKWGAPDHTLFQRFLKDLKEEKQQEPFFKIVQTSSSHEPFEVPFYRLDDKVLNAFAYADSCVGDFVRQYKETPMWKNTLIVLVPDHLGAYPRPVENPLEGHTIPLILIGGAVKEPRVVDTYASQIDIAATLLSQLGLPHDDFTFSKNIFNPSSPHFGYFTEPTLFGMVTAENQLVYNLDANTVQIDEGTEKGANLEKGKAFLQKLYDDLAKR